VEIDNGLNDARTATLAPRRAILRKEHENLRPGWPMINELGPARCSRLPPLGAVFPRSQAVAAPAGTVAFEAASGVSFGVWFVFRCGVVRDPASDDLERIRVSTGAFRYAAFWCATVQIGYNLILSLPPLPVPPLRRGCIRAG